MILQGQSVPQMVPGGGTGSSVVQTTNNNGLYQPVGVPNQILANPIQNQTINHSNISNANGNGGQTSNLNGTQLMSSNQPIMNGIPNNMNPGVGGRPRIMQNGGNLMGQPLNPPVPNNPIRIKRARAPKNPGSRASKGPRSKATQNQAPQQMLQHNNSNAGGMMNSMLNNHVGGSANANMPPNLANHHYHPQQAQPNPMQGIPPPSHHHHQQSANYFNDFETWQHQQQQQLNNSNSTNCHPQSTRLASNTPPMLPRSPSMILSYPPQLRRINQNGNGGGNIVSGHSPPNPNSNPNRMINPHQNYFPPQQQQTQQSQLLHHANPNNNIPPDVVFLHQNNNNSCDNPQQQQTIWHHGGGTNAATPPTNSSSQSLLNPTYQSQQQQHHQQNIILQNNINNTNNNNQGLSNVTAAATTTTNNTNSLQNHSNNNNISNNINSTTCNNNANSMMQRSSSFTHSPLPSNVLMQGNNGNGQSTTNPTLINNGQQQIMSVNSSEVTTTLVNNNNHHLHHTNSHGTNNIGGMTPNSSQLNHQVASPFNNTTLNQPSSRPQSRTNNLNINNNNNNNTINHMPLSNQSQPHQEFSSNLGMIVNPNDTIVFPITNGLVWGSKQINLNDIINQTLNNGIFYQTHEFDLSKNHLDTIINRSDLDIAISCHLYNEPIQLCQWPMEDIQIRFNNKLLALDRNLVVGGKPAHKVSCIKQLCIPGKNVIEISIMNLGDDPNNPEVIMRRRQASQNMKPFNFVAFMAHMPPLNLLLGGLQRRHTFDVSRFIDIVEWATANQQNKFLMVPLACPITRQRIRIPGRTTDCKHIETFDMEAFLHNEVLWPRLCCPICRKPSPSGLDGLCIDLTVQFALNTFPSSIESIYINNEGYWCLTPQSSINFPTTESSWQPIYGPMTENVSKALNDQNETKSGHTLDAKKSGLGDDNSCKNKPSSDSELTKDSPMILCKQDYSGIPKDLINFAASNTIILDPFLQTEYISFLEKYF